MERITDIRKQLSLDVFGPRYLPINFGCGEQFRTFRYVTFYFPLRYFHIFIKYDGQAQKKHKMLNFFFFFGKEIFETNLNEYYQKILLSQLTDFSVGTQSTKKGGILWFRYVTGLIGSFRASMTIEGINSIMVFRRRTEPNIMTTLKFQTTELAELPSFLSCEFRYVTKRMTV